MCARCYNLHNEWDRGEGMDRILHELISIMNETGKDETYHDLARILVENIDKIKNMNITQLAELCYVSTSTISRFCRELGFHNFSAFKNELCGSYGFEIDYNHEYTDCHTSIQSKLDYLQNETLSTLTSIHAVITDNDLIALAKSIHEAKNIVFFSQSHYQFLALYLQQRLALFKKIIYIDVEQRRQIARAEQMDENALAIIYSPRGQSFIFSRVSSLLSKKHIKTMLITQTDLAINASRYDKVIYIGGTNENNLGLISYLYLIDQLILVYYNLYHDELIV